MLCFSPIFLITSAVLYAISKLSKAHGPEIKNSGHEPRNILKVSFAKSGRAREIPEDKTGFISKCHFYQRQKAKIEKKYIKGTSRLSYGRYKLVIEKFVGYNKTLFSSRIYNSQQMFFFATSIIVVYL